MPCSLPHFRAMWFQLTFPPQNGYLVLPPLLSMYTFMSWLPGGVLWVITVFITAASFRFIWTPEVGMCLQLVVRTEQLFWSMVYCWYVSTDGQFSDCTLILAVWTKLGTDWIKQPRGLVRTRCGHLLHVVVVSVVITIVVCEEFTNFM